MQVGSLEADHLISESSETAQPFYELAPESDAEDDASSVQLLDSVAPSGRAPSANSAATGDASSTPPSVASLLDADVVLANEPPVRRHYVPHRPRDAQPPRAAAVPERQHQNQQAKATESEPAPVARTLAPSRMCA